MTIGVPGQQRLQASVPPAPTPPIQAAAPKAPANDPFSALNQRVKSQEAVAALAAARKEKEQFKPAVVPIAKTVEQAQKNNPVVRDLWNRRTPYDADSYAMRRSNFYATQFRPEQRIVIEHVSHSFQPNYGAWATGALLWSIFNDADFLVNHRNDRDVQLFMAQARQNGEMQAQITNLNARMAAMQNTPPNPNYVSPQVQAAGGADVMLAPEVVEAVTRPKLRLCTGSRQGNYFTWGQRVRSLSVAFVDVDVIETAGSVDNLDRLARGECDAASVQRDAHASYGEDHPGSATQFVRIDPPVAIEGVHLICSRQSKVLSITDLDPKQHIVLVGSYGSGSATTWQEFARMDPDHLGKVEARQGGDNQNLTLVATNARYDGKVTACMVYVASKKTEFVRKAESDRRLVLAHAWDSRLENRLDPGEGHIYIAAYFGADTYPALSSGQGNYVNTAGVYTDLLLATTWKDANPQLADMLIGAVQQATVR